MTMAEQRAAVRSNLADATWLLRRALAVYEEVLGGADGDPLILAEKRQQIAEAFINIAALEQGLPPACDHRTDKENPS
ncbi:hypothetical protein ACFVH6_21680 [Spirillospora sp. NPDC127200]